MMPLRNVAIALALAALVAGVEYFFRHYLLFWMPVIGSLRVNDMVSLALAYSLLTVVIGSLTHVDWGSESRGLVRALRELVTQWTYTAWFGAVILSLVVLSMVDGWLWGGARVPMWVSNYRNSTIWFASAAPVLGAVATIAVNGVLVPVAEEFLWRGQIQARLLGALPAAPAIGVTATLFSLKHVLVDASWARFLTLIAFGAICGIVASRASWRNSAALHLFVNTLATVVGLARE